MKKIRATLQIVFGLIFIGGAGFVAWILMRTAPETVPEDKKESVKIVQVVALKPGNERILVTAWGTVIPAREVTIRPQVGGRIISQHESLVPGGILKAEDELVRIDPLDYELVVTERKAEFEDAQLELEVEKGRQIIAKREWEQLRNELPGADMNSSLALREPQLRRTEAMMTKAQNAIDQAELDLKRTVVTAPFNCMVVEESVEIGQLVEKGDTIGRMVGTDSFWVRATLPISDLKRIRLPSKGKEGASAEILIDTGGKEESVREGTVVRLLSDLESTGRMARVLVEVEDPLNIATGAESSDPLLLGSYVRVDIEAGHLSDVLTVPRNALREGNRLWVVGQDNRIRIVEPEILWTLPETVLVENQLQSGERLVVSELKSALPGMLVNPQPLGADPKATDAP